MISRNWLGILLVFIVGTTSRAQHLVPVHDTTGSTRKLLSVADLGRHGFPSVASLPLLRKGIQTHQFCSYDRAGDNYDHEYFSLYTDKNGELVLFDAYGPGVLLRQQMNVWHENTDDVHIRYYFDDEPQPRIDMDISQFFSEENPLGLFREGLSDNGGKDYRILYGHMPFRKRLKVTLTREPGGPGMNDFSPWTGRYDSIPGRRSHWYQYTYHLFSEDQGEASWSATPDMSATLHEWKEYRNAHRHPHVNKHRRTAEIGAGQSHELLHIAGSGALESLFFKLEPLEPDALFNTWLKIYFDDRPTASVDVPLGNFFGAFPDSVAARYNSFLMGYEADNGMYCNFPMPFWRSVRIVLDNRSDKTIPRLESHIGIDPEAASRYPENQTGYFHAAFNRAFPRKEGYDYTFLTRRGHGHIVGHNSHRWNASTEENERTYFDESSTPQIQGDGFEDDQGFGWGLKGKTFDLFGAPVARGTAECLYRFFIPDLYVFYNQVKHGHQTYGPFSPRGHEGLYTTGKEQSVTYYYVKEKPSLVLTDELDVGNRASEKQHRYRTAGKSPVQNGSYWYDGELNNVLFPTPAIRDDGRHVRRHSKFTLTIDPSNQGIRIRRRTDKENNRQLARVYIDGVPVTERPWYTVDQEHSYRDIRWLDSSIEIPASYTRGKSSVTVQVEHLDSETGGIDEYYYWVYSYLF